MILIIHTAFSISFTHAALRILELEGNALHSLPNDIGKLNALEHLNLEDNELDSLPESMAQLTRLQVWLSCSLALMTFGIHGMRHSHFYCSLA